MDDEKVREATPGDPSSPDLSSDDTFLSPDSSFRKKAESLSNLDKDESNKQHGDKNESHKQHGDKDEPNKQHGDKDDTNKPQEFKAAHIDNSAPFESVKEAVSKFGGIVDWKAHRVQKIERRKYIEEEIEKAQQEIPIFKEKAQQAEQEKEQALRELDGRRRLIQDLKLTLERAQTEERQAKQDSELAQLRVQEMEQGIADESSVAAKTQLEVAKARHQAAASELKAATNELEETRKDYQILISERDAAVQKAQEASSAAKEIEREVEDLTIQLIATKESIESTHASHLEAEEHRMQEAKERDEEMVNLDVEMKQTDEELVKVEQQIVFAKDQRSKLEKASGLLRKLKDELAIYMQGKLPEEDDDEQFTRKDIQSGVAVARKSLDEVHANIEKTTEEIMCLKAMAKTYKGKLESEKQVLTNVRKQKGLGAGAVVNLESELKRTRSELEDIRRKEKEAREKLVELPKQLQKVTEETEKVKKLVEEARSVLKKAKAEAEDAKNGVNSLSSRLAATQKEIDAARAQERIALGAINALQATEPSKGQKNDGGVTISLEEYYEMSKRAHAAEEAANKRVEEANAKIDEAKDAEMQTLNKLTQLNKENAAKKDALNAANQRAEMANESTRSIQEELNKRQGKGGEAQKGEARGGLLKRLSQKGSQDSPKPSAGSPAPDPADADGVDPDENGNTSESGRDIRGFFRRKKKSMMPKFNFINMKKKPLFNKNSS